MLPHMLQISSQCPNVVFRFWVYYYENPGQLTYFQTKSYFGYGRDILEIEEDYNFMEKLFISKCLIPRG